MKERLLLSLLLLFFCFVAQAQGIYNNAGASMVVTGDLHLVLTNARLQNNGNFVAGTGTVSFNGNAATANSNISGSSATTFHHLTINKMANDVGLAQNIAVEGNLNMVSGNLLLNGNTIDLGSGAGTIIGEKETSHITGTTGGSIRKTVVLNAPVSVNPGNIGMEITSPANIGTTEIIRKHIQPTSANGGLGIYRSFDIIPTNNTSLNATLKFYYLDAELGVIPENELIEWQSIDMGAKWLPLGYAQRDNSNNWVVQPGIQRLDSRFTLGSNTTFPLPVSLLSFTGKYLDNNKTVVLLWTTTTEVNTDHFEIERSSDGINFTTIGARQAVGNSTTKSQYSYMDIAPLPGINYYRLKIVDNNRKSAYSSVIIMKAAIGNTTSIMVYPNPAKAVVTLSFETKTAGKYALQLYNGAGQLIETKQIEAVKGNNNVQWNVSRLPSGQYSIRCATMDQVPARFIKE